MQLGINPYLFFTDGKCREAMEHYARVLGGEVTMMMPYGGSPAEESAPPEWKDKILHATLTIGGQVIMGSDGHPGYHEKPQGFSVSCQVRSAADAERVFAGLADGGKVGMPLAATFFSERFGMLTDRYGIAWMVNFPGSADAHAAAGREMAGAASDTPQQKPAEKSKRAGTRKK
jgi:PhnB protein